jgi:hypothetical protein
MDLLYLTILSRLPTDDERASVGYEGGEQMTWALINCEEFLFRH